MRRIPIRRQNGDSMAQRLQPHRGINHQSFRSADAQIRMHKDDIAHGSGRGVELGRRHVRRRPKEEGGNGHGEEEGFGLEKVVPGGKETFPCRFVAFPGLNEL